MKKKILKIGIGIFILLASAGAGTAYYLFNLPHRDVAGSAADHQISVDALVAAYVTDPVGADARYLSEDGDSKILEITGFLHSTSTDFNGNTVLIFRDTKHPVDVNIYLNANQSEAVPSPGQEVRVKGVITAGTAYDEDLEQYTPITIAQANLLKP